MKISMISEWQILKSHNRILYESCDDLDREVLDIEDCGNYEIRHEMVRLPDSADEPTEMFSAYSKDGGYIGDVETAKYLDDRGIKPELIDSDHCVCSIGFCEKENKWYGWSHRAIYGYGIGEEPGDLIDHAASGPVKTMDQARQYAIEFAKSVA